MGAVVPLRKDHNPWLVEQLTAACALAAINRAAADLGQAINHYRKGELSVEMVNAARDAVRFALDGAGIALDCEERASREERGEPVCEFAGCPAGPLYEGRCASHALPF